MQSHPGPADCCLCKNPGSDGIIHRSDRIPDTVVGLSRFQEVTLNQGRMERFFLDNIKKHSRDTIRVERGMLPESLDIDETKIGDDDAYPITVKLRQLSEEEATPAQQIKGSKVKDGLFRSNLVYEDDHDGMSGQAGTIETIKAKYVIGCDGARSWTRCALGFELQGEATDFIWGVIDCVPITDFRMYCCSMMFWNVLS
jgi:phenol 2-monooxygenase (NADPH)